MNKIFTFIKEKLFIYAFGAATVSIILCAVGFVVLVTFLFVDSLYNNITLNTMLITAKITWVMFITTVVFTAVGGLSLLMYLMGVRYNK
jgi:hypothetical protein